MHTFPHYICLFFIAVIIHMQLFSYSFVLQITTTIRNDLNRKMWVIIGYGNRIMGSDPMINNRRLYYKQRKHLSKKVSGLNVNTDIEYQASDLVKNVKDNGQLTVVRKKPIDTGYSDYLGDSKSRSQGLCETNHCDLYVNGTLIPYNYTSNWKYPKMKGTTAVIAITSNRLFIMSSFFDRWGGPSCIIIWSHKTERGVINSWILSLRQDEQQSVIIYTKDDLSVTQFPINHLRNICIRNIHTSHFVVFDADMMPSDNLYSMLQSIPDTLLNDDRSAFIIPSFFINPILVLSRCTSIDQCLEIGLSIAPHSYEQLEECIVQRKCKNTRDNSFTHLLITSLWFSIPDNITIAKITCFPREYQEPYTVLRYIPNLPLMDERFHDYGYNKIGYIERLKYYIHSFYIIAHAFAVDLPHYKSDVAKSFKEGMKNHRPVENKQLFENLVDEMNRTLIKESTFISDCRKGGQKMYIWDD